MSININKKRFSLILSNNFEPLSVCNVKKTLKYLINGHGKALDPVSVQLYEFDEWIARFTSEVPEYTIKSSRLWLLIPEIIILNTNKIHTHKKQKNIVSKRKVFERDGNVCGYCGKLCSTKDRTIDHIFPVSKGGSTNEYTNVVTACRTCNGKKGNKTLQEIGWKLIHKIVNPQNSFLCSIPREKWLESWRPYLKNESF